MKHTKQTSKETHTQKSKETHETSQQGNKQIRKHTKQASEETSKHCPHLKPGDPVNVVGAVDRKDSRHLVVQAVDLTAVVRGDVHEEVVVDHLVVVEPPGPVDTQVFGHICLPPFVAPGYPEQALKDKE